MLIYSTIKLIKSEYAPDEMGRQIATETEREIFAEISSISQGEFFKAGQSGISPEVRAVIWTAEYDGERIAEAGGVRYTIYRIYNRNDKTELYMSQKVGT